MSFRDRSQSPDYSSKDGAEALIQRIKAAWERRGFPAPDLQAIAVGGDYTGTSELMRQRVDVRSNMKNGLPVQQNAEG